MTGTSNQNVVYFRLNALDSTKPDRLDSLDGFRV